jgi:hypothetical protein
MTRLLVLGLLLVVLWLAVKGFTVQLKAAVLGQTSGRGKPPAPRETVETLVRCARCGTYVAASRALKAAAAEDAAFCSEKCILSGHP